MTDIPRVNRISFHDHVTAAVPEDVPPDEAGRVVADVVRLEPLHKIQTAFDQIVRHADDRAAGRPFDYPQSFLGHVEDVIGHATRFADVLGTAFRAATTMIEQMRHQVYTFEAAMTKRKDEDEAPQLTTSGEPHPLQAGGYDPDADPQKPGNISDVEALKEGKTTRQQAEAIAAADAEGDEDEEPTPSDAATDEDEPEPRKSRSPKHPKK